MILFISLFLPAASASAALSGRQSDTIADVMDKFGPLSVENNKGEKLSEAASDAAAAGPFDLPAFVAPKDSSHRFSYGLESDQGLQREVFTLKVLPDAGKADELRGRIEHEGVPFDLLSYHITASDKALHGDRKAVDIYVVHKAADTSTDRYLVESLSLDEGFRTSSVSEVLKGTLSSLPAHAAHGRGLDSLSDVDVERLLEPLRDLRIWRDGDMAVDREDGAPTLAAADFPTPCAHLVKWIDKTDSQQSSPSPSPTPPAIVSAHSPAVVSAAGHSLPSFAQVASSRRANHTLAPSLAEMPSWLPSFSKDTSVTECRGTSIRGAHPLPPSSHTASASLRTPSVRRSSGVKGTGTVRRGRGHGGTKKVVRAAVAHAINETATVCEWSLVQAFSV